MTLQFSIIVPTLNRRSMLLQALASIDTQQWPAVEIIVVDGGSVDGTVEEMADRPNIRLLTGPDRGVYDAFNKGIALAAGDIVGILNSDDLYEPGTFTAVAEAFAAEPAADCVCGSAALAAGDQVVQLFDSEADKCLSSPRPAMIGSCILNARFFRRSALTKIGPFNSEFQFVADRDWLTRWYESDLVTAAIPNLVYRYCQHAGSLTFDAERRGERAIREELLQLSRQWRDAPGATSETKRVAMLLEGRCVAVLAAKAIRAGDFAEFWQWLFTRGGRFSLHPLIAASRGSMDVAAQALRSPQRENQSQVK